VDGRNECGHDEKMALVRLRWPVEPGHDDSRKIPLPRCAVMMKAFGSGSALLPPLNP
jgi:hypothetical protein